MWGFPSGCDPRPSGAIRVYYTPGVGFTTGIGTYYFLPDGVGNNSGIVDSGQFQADTYWYFAYGQTTVYHQGFYTPYKFEGKHGYYADGDSGMVLLGARYYLPTTHGFLTQDPRGHDAGLNLYLYGDDNPLSKVDPSGLDPQKAPLPPWKQTYPTIDAAAVAVLNYIYPRSERIMREIGGVITRVRLANGKFAYQPSYEMIGDTDHSMPGIPLQNEFTAGGANVVAWYHTHPPVSEADSENPSESDVKISNGAYVNYQRQYLGYIASPRAVWRYVPGYVGSKDLITRRDQWAGPDDLPRETKDRR